MSTTWLTVYAKPASTVKVKLPELAMVALVVLSNVWYLSPAGPVGPVAPVIPAPPKVALASVSPM
jgi:hypothetical protein